MILKILQAPLKFLYVFLAGIYFFIFPLGLAQPALDDTQIGPYPLVAEVKTVGEKSVARILIYPQTIEFYNDKQDLAYIAGYYPYQGRVWIFVILPNQTEPVIIASSRGGIVYNSAGDNVASYRIIGANSLLFNANFEKIGSVFCALKMQLCAVAAIVYLNGMIP